ncbi:hypothetical protein YB2330_005672 [Saitoella coloradoensis]
MEMDDQQLTYTISHRSQPYTILLPSSATLGDLKSALASLTSIPPQNQKLLYKPPHLADDSELASALLDRGRGKIMMIGTPAATVAAIQQTPTLPLPRQRKMAAVPVRRPLRQAPSQADLRYTFHTIQPLPHLPNSTHAHAILSKLASDPAVRAIMLRHEFSVGVLSELDPATNTNHAGRTLGLNTNHGAKIELRLRTDEGGGHGWRRYKDVKDVLAHELAHNVYREHDAQFWRLCRRLEGEMRAFEGGRKLVDGVEYYKPGEEGGERERVDEGGWVGGSGRVGGGEGDGGGKSRRELAADAAAARSSRMGSGKGDENGNGQKAA